MALAPFAVVSDLTKRGVTLQVTEAVALQILTDASDHLRSVIGHRIYPQTTSTFDLYLAGGPQWVTMPVRPLISIGTVSMDGVAISDLQRVGDSIKVCGPGKLTITATFGFATAPDDLVSWTCVIASQVLSTLSDLGALSAGEVASFGIDDYRKAFFKADVAGSFSLPKAITDRLAASYGGGFAVTGALD